LKIQGWRERWLVAIAYRILKIWSRTLRYELEDRGNFVKRPLDRRCIASLWHNRLLLICIALKKFVPHRPGAGLISASRDGDLVADLTKRLGFEVVRGSSSRFGASAMLELAAVLASGIEAFITPDGPRGPIYQLGPGIIFLAQKTGAAVQPMNIEYSSCWRLKSWDRFILPRPFATIRVIFGPEHHVAQTTTEEEFERERLRLQDAMMALVERK
jgi:lysophospholipid acyltransferase (LPLAT)-like uncharacterized protein